jgi:hypothetical protein
VEPRAYDRWFYAGVLLLSFILIVAATAYAVFRTAFNTEPPPPGPSFDLTGFTVDTGAQPDPENPCIVLQEHLEATRKGAYRSAYAFLCKGLKDVTSYDQFVANAKANNMLFRDVDGYRCSTYEVNGTAAKTVGYMEYKTGGRSKVETHFAREGDSWRIALMTVIYQ